MADEQNENLDELREVAASLTPDQLAALQAQCEAVSSDQLLKWAPLLPTLSPLIGIPRQTATRLVDLIIGAKDPSALVPRVVQILLDAANVAEERLNGANVATSGEADELVYCPVCSAPHFFPITSCGCGYIPHLREIDN